MGQNDHCPSCDINLSLTSSKFLNCLHAYCSHCLRKMENRLRALSGQNNRSGSLNRRSFNSNSSNSGQLGNILCPKCHTLSHLTIRYGIDKLITSNFIYEPLPGRHGIANLNSREFILRTISQHQDKIVLKCNLVQRFKGEANLRKSRFLTRISDAREYLESFVSKTNGSFDSKKLALLKQIQKMRLRVTNFLVSKITLLEQLEIDLQYLFDLANRLKKRIEVPEDYQNSIIDHRRSAAPMFYHKMMDKDRHIKNSCHDNRFSLASALVQKEDEVNFEEMLSESILPLFGKRFEFLSNTLNNAIYSIEDDLIAAESLTENPRIVYLPENYSLFEKVVCEVPILIVDGNNVPIIGSHHLQEMT